MQKKTPPINEMIDFINNHKLNYGTIADYIGIHAGTFSEKIRGTRYSKFTQAQTESMWEYLKDMSKQINNL